MLVKEENKRKTRDLKEIYCYIFNLLSQKRTIKIISFIACVSFSKIEKLNQSPWNFLLFALFVVLAVSLEDDPNFLLKVKSDYYIWSYNMTTLSFA